jgi:hypothetical protein
LTAPGMWWNGQGMEGVWVILVLGIAIGFVIGRGWAERGRAKFDGKGAWEARKRYRGTRPF